MDQVDLLSIGSYTELPGGNIALPQGYSSLLAPIINVRVHNYIDISIVLSIHLCTEHSRGQHPEAAPDHADTLAARPGPG